MKLKSKIIGFSSLVLIPVATTSVLISCSNQADMKKELFDKLEEKHQDTKKFLSQQIKRLTENIGQLKEQLKSFGENYAKDLLLSKENFLSLVDLYKKIKNNSKYTHKDLKNVEIKIAAIADSKLNWTTNSVTNKSNFAEIKTALENFNEKLNTHASELKAKVVELEGKITVLNKQIADLKKEISEGHDSIDDAKDFVNDLNDLIGKITSDNFQFELEVQTFINKKLNWVGKTKNLEVKDATLKTKTTASAFEEIKNLKDDALLTKLGITSSDKIVAVTADKVKVTYGVDSIQNEDTVKGILGGIKIKITITSTSKGVVKNEKYSYLITGFKK